MNIEQFMDTDYKNEKLKITSADLNAEGHGWLTFSIGQNDGECGYNYADYWFVKQLRWRKGV